jgi:hypothetical protein
VNLTLLKKALGIIKKATEYLNLQGVIGRIRAPRFLGYTANRRTASKSGKKPEKPAKISYFQEPTDTEFGTHHEDDFNEQGNCRK